MSRDRRRSSLTCLRAEVPAAGGLREDAEGDEFMSMVIGLGH
jgi:hypothetical protein